MECSNQPKPDKGIAWVVLCISTFLNMIYGMILYSFGVFYLYFLEDFRQGHSNTSWIGSVFGGTALLAGKHMIYKLNGHWSIYFISLTASCIVEIQ